MESSAAEQLAAIADARAAVADRLVTPWWYHPALGLLVGAYVVAFGIGNSAARLAAGVCFAGGCVLLVKAYKRQTGVWVSGLDAGRASRWAIAMGAMLGVIALAAVAIGRYSDLRWPVWALAIAGFAGTVLLGRQFDRALRAQLRAAA
ncbi:hypothetical protein ACPCHT_17670 [Nucisporomicrobium flavum]|jgi:hypothetical protein|uniref:hypothetical protein n=1 Tax=Nucisporomicrobium flavum TaxID=2785915 RepID=UPI003C2D5B55